MKFLVEIEQEVDGRWIAEVMELPGVMSYGKTLEEAKLRVQALALRVIADDQASIRFPSDALKIRIPGFRFLLSRY
jgi:predicted RNase H-like HicB family nuclease